jgi:hypothetical protein
MRLVTRAQWGARAPRQRQALAKSQQAGTAVHYSAADADEQADHGNCDNRVRGIQNFHMDGRGWSDIAYSYLACKHGYVFEGRGRGIRTAAQGTNWGNDGYHAVCFLGDDTAGRDDVTDIGRAAIKDAVTHCNAWAGVSGVRPHSSFHSTACPGDDLRGWITRGMPTSSQEEPDMTTDDLLDALESDRGQKALRSAVTHVLRQATGRDDATQPAGEWFEGQRGPLKQILDRLSP